jgi:pre-mRNA-processing factor 19
MDLHVGNNSIVATGGVDKQAIIYNHTEDKIVSTFKGHSKKVTGIALHPSSDVVLSCSLDSTVCVWNSQSGDSISTITVRLFMYLSLRGFFVDTFADFQAHSKGVSGLSLHPIGDYVLSGSADKSWAFSDIRTARTISSSSGSAGVSSIQWHPDGIIFGAGTSDK